MSTVETAPVRRGGSTSTQRSRPPLTVLVRALIAVIVSVGVCALLWKRIPHTITDKTDAIGYPTWADFDVHVYFDKFHIVAYWFPGLAVVSYAAMTWLPSLMARRRSPAAAMPPLRTEDPLDVPVQPGRAAQLGRTAVAGTVLGLEIAVWRGGDHATRNAALVALAWTASVYALGWLASRVRAAVSTVSVASFFNAMAAPASILLLLPVSSVTVLTTLDDKRAHAYPWLPWWVAAIAALVALAVVLQPRRGGHPGASSLGERRGLLYVVIPAALYLLIAYLPGALPGGAWVFEEGHWLAGQQILGNGAFPWRDVIMDHGLFNDGLRPMLGLLTFGDSRWGSWAGDQFIWVPAFVLSLYYLAAYLVRRRSIQFPLAVALVLAAGTPLLYADIRFFLYGYLVVLLIATLRRPAVWRGGLLGSLMAIQAILVPESAYIVFAFGLALVGYEWTHRGSLPLLQAFRRTLSVAAGGAVVGAALVVVLIAAHALGAFIDYYRIFLDAHDLVGGIPHIPLIGWIAWYAAMPVAGWLTAVAYLAFRVARRMELRIVDWALAATATMAVLYYGKFLARADTHVLDPYGVSLPMLVILACLAVELIDRISLRIPSPRSLRSISPGVRGQAGSVLLLVAAAVVVLQPLTQVVHASPSRYRPVADSEPAIAKLGYATADAFDPKVYDDLQVVARTYLGNDPRILDFSNETGIFYYLLDLQSPTRYYHIALAIPAPAQDEMVKQLEASPPKLVLMNNYRYGLPTWDVAISNQVRHHVVAQWVFDNYHPFFSIDTQVFFVRNGLALPPVSTIAAHLSEPPVTTGLDFKTGVCDWGYEPDHLSVQPSAAEQAAATTVWSGSSVPAGTLTVPPPQGHTWSDYRWVEIDASGNFNADGFAVYQTAHDADHNIIFGTKTVSPHRYLIHVGGCGQWHGYANAPLVLDHTQPQPITAVRLIP